MNVSKLLRSLPLLLVLAPTVHADGALSLPAPDQRIVTLDTTPALGCASLTFAARHEADGQITLLGHVAQGCAGSIQAVAVMTVDGVVVARGYLQPGGTVDLVARLDQQNQHGTACLMVDGKQVFPKIAPLAAAYHRDRCYSF